MLKLKNILGNILLFLIDIAILFILLKGAIIIRLKLLPILISPLPVFKLGLEHFWWFFPIWLGIMVYERLYTKRFTFWDEVEALWKVSFLATLVIFTIVSIGKLTGEVSRTVIMSMGLLSLLGFPLIRTNAKKILIKIGFLRRKVIIMGAGKTGELALRALKQEPNLGYKVVGFIDNDPDKVGKRIDGIKIHCSVDKTDRYIKRCGIQDIIVAMPGANREKLINLVNKLQHKADNILFIPDLFGMAVLSTNLQHFFHEQTVVLEIKNNLAKPLNFYLKRGVDFTLSAILLILLAVPMAVIAILIRLTSSGAAIFTHERIGRHGEYFKCYKFRTMYKDAEEKLKSLLENNPSAKEEWEKHWKLKDDPRATPIGRFLRKTSMDELPQLLNAIKGEMSLVGPRPYLPREQDLLGDFKETILSVPPGITGLWQTTGRSTTIYPQRIALDTWYVRNWNLWLDIVILLKTIPVIFVNREGAY